MIGAVPRQGRGTQFDPLFSTAKVHTVEIAMTPDHTTTQDHLAEISPFVAGLDGGQPGYTRISFPQAFLTRPMGTTVLRWACKHVTRV